MECANDREIQAGKAIRVLPHDRRSTGDMMQTRTVSSRLAWSETAIGVWLAVPNLPIACMSPTDGAEHLPARVRDVHIFKLALAREAS